MNPYASYATTAVDIAGTNHIIWENNGQLIHAIYDQNSGTWDQAKSITNAQGGKNLKLLAAPIIPYGENEFAPGLMAFWEKGIGNAREIYAVVGRYDASGAVIWSEAVQITQDGVADQGTDVTFSGDGGIELVYQKVLGLDPRNPEYALDPLQMGTDAANPNRDDSDLYRSALSIDLDSETGQTSLLFSSGQTIPLTFPNSSREMAIYYPLGSGVQGLSSETSPTLSEQSFPAGISRSFNLNLSLSHKFLNLKVPFLAETTTVGLTLDSNIEMSRNQQYLEASLAAAINKYSREDGKKKADTGISFSNQARKGSLISLGGWGVRDIGIDSTGRINYQAQTGQLAGLQRSFDIYLDLYKSYQVNLGTKNINLGQMQAEADLFLGLGVAYTFTDPKNNTNPPFAYYLPNWALKAIDNPSSGGPETAYLMSTVPAYSKLSKVERAAIGEVGKLDPGPILISAFDISMPPWPWPAKEEYQQFGYGFQLPLDLTLTGTVGILKNVFKAQSIATAGLDFDLEVDPDLQFTIPWQVGIQVDLQAAIFKWSWSWGTSGTFLNPAPGSASSTTNSFNPNNLASGLIPLNGSVTVSYNPYTGSTNNYQNSFSSVTNPNQIAPSSTYQIRDITLSSGGSQYLNGRNGSFQIALTALGVSDPALVNVYVNQGVISGFTVVDPGSGYSTNQVLSLDTFLNSSGGSGATAEITVTVTDTTTNTGRLGQVTVTNGGSGYLGGKSGIFVVSPTQSTTPSAQSFLPGLLSVTVTNGVITAVNVLSGGSGYQPGQVSVDFSQNGGGGTGGSATATLTSNQVQNVVNDGPPSISSITQTLGDTVLTATTMAWVADGSNDQVPLTNLSQNSVPTSRVQAAVLSGSDWGAPESIPNEGSRGFNFDPAIGYYLNGSSPSRLLVWAHADGSSLNSQSSSSEITQALLSTDIYYSYADSGNSWQTPILLTQNSGSDTKVTLGPGPTDNELVAAWVNTSDTTGQTIYTAIFNGLTQQWSSPVAIPNSGLATSQSIDSLEVGELQGSPAIFWSDATDPGYAYSVIKDKPDLYFRLDERNGAVVATNGSTGGQRSNAVYVGTVSYGQPGALLAANGSGDPNTSVGFNGQGYILVPGTDTQSSLGDFSVEFWVNANDLSPNQSLVDQGGYNLDAVLPTATISLSVTKTPTQDEQGNWGFAYAVAVLPTTAITVNNPGSGLSSFNLDFDLAGLLPNRVLTLPDDTQVALAGVPQLDLDIQAQVLAGITPGPVTQILGTTFVIDPAAQGQTSTTSTLNQGLTFTQTPGWYVRTGSNNSIVFNAGGGEIVADSLSPQAWYYVVATYDANSQVASLYINGELKKQQQGSRFAPSSVPLVLGYNFSGQLDEVAYYNGLLTPNTNVGTTNNLGQVDSLTFNSVGQITNHYNNRYSSPNAATDATFYSVYDAASGTWGTPSQFSTEAADRPTSPLLERSPVVDIVSNSFQLMPDGQPDSRVRIQVPETIAPGTTITGIKILKVVSSDNTANWTVGNAPDPGWAIGVIVNGQLINPLNPSTDFSYTVMSENPTLDLYFQDSSFESDLLPGQTVNVIFYTSTNSGESTPTIPIPTTIPITATIIPNPSSTIAQATEAGKEQIAIGTILENEVTNLNQVDSGAILNVPNNAGTAVAAGHFMLSNSVGTNLANAIVVSQSSADAGRGIVWVLPAGSNDIIEANNVNELSTTTVPQDGVLIKHSNPDGSTSFPPQIGTVLAVGDVDGDGVDDLIIGASQANNANGDKSGNVYIISGTSITPNQTIDLANNPGVTLIGQEGSQSGFSIAIGDVNGDGIDDIVVGAPYASYTINNKNEAVGAVYLVLGNKKFFDDTSTNPNTVNLDSDNVILTGTSGSHTDQYIQNKTWTSQVGFSVAVSSPKPTPPFFDFASPLSVNGDRFADIIIGAPNYRQDVEFNGDGVNQNATGTQAQNYSTTLTTVPSTGRGASYSKNLQTGRAYIVFGSQNPTYNLSENSLTGSNGIILDGAPILNSDAQLGYAVSTGGDVNGDGFDDVVFGAPEGNDATGLSFILQGRSKNNPFNKTTYVLSREADLILGGSSTFAKLGKTLNLSGDLNGDGLADLVLGSPNSEYSTGEAFIVFGSDNIFNGSTPTYQSLQPGAAAGVMKLSGGIAGGLAAGALFSGSNLNDQDANGKIYDSLVVASPYSGQVYVVYGHEWLADDGNLKLTNLAGNNGLIIDGSDLSNTFAQQELDGLSHSSPSMTNDGDDTLFITVRGTNGTDYVASSTNGGQSWGGFNPLPPGEETDDYFPSIAFYDGVLYSIFHD
ncbi:FG-GAP-like repeat-containing protein [Thermosynechococcaceae cyanobacterium BACA0444]|uniref:FG-GAP-like repeat-containing protein n=1 Tax=Pseudocalidococcus azoricus BACA0444 TaxID=2918990 RepID=A0AAE4JVU0_9CYAN|nr:FG-GAP-like repeat-containing protein [Pseudocalidococcus azoricus]MDS3860715.1 FG-GAP-like repeat-containing protein [Pseudocalidococcus azoricus BACA0444]